ncbi:MAG: phospholipase D-like domain-containing protein, partial [Candidatus Helarchaeota archaeon]
MRRIIDNEPTKYQIDKYTMANALQEIIEQYKPETVDIAVGFFNLSGWRLLENHLHQLKSSRFLIGWEVSNRKNVEREIQEWFTHKLEDIPLDEYTQTLSDVKSLIAFLEKKNPKWSSYSEKIKEEHPEWEFANQFRLYTRPHIHGKLYLFPNIAILGSSNFTGGGLTGNTELNISIEDPDILLHLKGWFEHFFNSSRSIDYRPILLKQLRDSKFGDREYDPYWVFLKIVFELQKQEIKRNIEDKEEVVRLAEFQQEGVARALDIIDDFGGVMIADAVGLGKSYMGVSILRTLAIRAPPMKNNILVVCPAQLKEDWEEHLLNAGLTSATIYTQEMMSRSPIEKKAYDIILVDESHNFRRPKPKRYSNFMNLLTRKEPKVILLTATPINTTEFDLYYQLKLIFKNKDTALSDSLNIPNLNDYFKSIVNGVNDLSLITEHLLVARSRSVIRYRQKVLKQDIILPN